LRAASRQEPESAGRAARSGGRATSRRGGRFASSTAKRDAVEARQIDPTRQAIESSSTKVDRAPGRAPRRARPRPSLRGPRQRGVLRRLAIMAARGRRARRRCRAGLAEWPRGAPWDSSARRRSRGWRRRRRRARSCEETKDPLLPQHPSSCPSTGRAVSWRRPSDAATAPGHLLWLQRPLPGQRKKTPSPKPSKSSAAACQARRRLARTASAGQGDERDDAMSERISASSASRPMDALSNQGGCSPSSGLSSERSGGNSTARPRLRAGRSALAGRGPSVGASRGPEERRRSAASRG